MPHHRLGPGGLHGGHLRRTSQPRPRALRRHAARRTAHHHHRHRELPRPARAGQRLRAHGTDATPGPTLRCRHPQRQRHRGRLLAPPLHRHRRRHGQRRGRHRHHRHRGQRQVPRPARRAEVRRGRRVGLRHVRRLLLPQEDGGRRRRRRLRLRGSLLPLAPRLQGVPRGAQAPPPRLPNHAAARDLRPQHRDTLPARSARPLRREVRRRSTPRAPHPRGRRRRGSAHRRPLPGHRPPPEHRGLPPLAPHRRSRLPPHHPRHAPQPLPRPILRGVVHHHRRDPERPQRRDRPLQARQPVVRHHHGAHRLPETPVQRFGHARPLMRQAPRSPPGRQQAGASRGRRPARKDGWPCLGRGRARRSPSP